MVTLKLAESNTFPATDNLFQTAFWGKIKTAAGQRGIFLEQTAASLSSFCGTDCFMIRTIL
ncbi:hypothetical protein [uncultured Treponema sp.]|uniref:hypothetical protein n=1 Tax=uncultured Treponema sp. TaxID=162155 RepID=UPI0025831967|nr:hypothetical protein [uncultured Treponema sp.]